MINNMSNAFNKELKVIKSFANLLLIIRSKSTINIALWINPRISGKL